MADQAETKREQNTRTRGNGQGTLYQRTPGGPWRGSFYDHDGSRPDRSTGTTDRRTAERILARWVAEAALRREGVVDATAETIAAESRRPIGEHLSDWRAALRAKGSSKRRVGDAYRRANRVCDDQSIGTLADVTAARLRRFVQAMQDDDAAARTINGYMQAFRQFIRWAVGERRLASDPTAGVSSVKVIGQTRERRPLDADELARQSEPRREAARALLRATLIDDTRPSDLRARGIRLVEPSALPRI